MSMDAARQFYDKYNANSDIKAAVDKCWKIEQTIALGRQHGYDFSSEEALATIGTPAENNELSDLALEAVSGGTPICCSNCNQNGPG